MTTKYIPITPLNFHSEIRVDTHGDEVAVSVYNCDIHHLDLLIQQLEALKAEYSVALHIANVIPDEPPQMTAVLGKKPESTDWYKNALQKEAARIVEQPKPMSEPKPETLPIMPQRKRGKNIINVMSVSSKSFVRGGHTYEGTINPYENADIVKNSWIRIYGISDKMTKWDKETKTSTSYRVTYDRSFKMGDEVEYDSYNMSYTGKIIAIGEKTIKIEHSYGGKVTQLDLHTFIRRNWDLDLAKIAEDNANWSMTS